MVLLSIFRKPLVEVGRAGRTPRGKPSVPEDLFHGLWVVVDGQPRWSIYLYNALGHGFGLGTGTEAEGWISDAIRFWEYR